MKNNILVRGIKLIEILATLGPLSIEQIYQEIKISRSAIYRILCILEELKYVARYRNNAEDIWLLDLKLLKISSSILARFDLRNLLRDILVRLANTTDEIVQLGVLQNDKVLLLEVIKRPKSLINVSGIGDEIAINISAAGMAIAAFKDEKEMDTLLENKLWCKYTDKTFTTKEAIKNELKEIRKRGYSLDDQNFAIGHRCIGAPVFDYTNNVIAGINISGHISTFSDNRLEELAKIVMQSAKEASIRLGYSE
jgi:IclR family transcriptional regulator, KDG regulon repressor